MQTKLFSKSDIPYYEEYWENYFPILFDKYTSFEYDKMTAILEDRSKFNNFIKEKELILDFRFLSDLILNYNKLKPDNISESQFLIEFEIDNYNNIKIQSKNTKINLIIQNSMQNSLNAVDISDIKIDSDLKMDNWMKYKICKISKDFFLFPFQKDIIVYIFKKDSILKDQFKFEIRNQYGPFNLEKMNKIMSYIIKFEKSFLSPRNKHIKWTHLHFFKDFLSFRYEYNNNVLSKWSIILAKASKNEN